jgi:GNAT superfamily N-acetyltransferase
LSRNEELSICQFVEAWRILCAPSPAHAIESADGIEYAFSGVPIAFLNAAILTRRDLSGDALGLCGKTACEWAASRGVPWLLIATHEREQPEESWTAPLESAGLVSLGPLTGMASVEIAPPSRIPDGLELYVADDDASCEAVFALNSAAYGMPFEAANPIWGRRSFWKDHSAVLGTSAGKPVTCAAVMMVQDYRYVALVATEPAQQRRGYADAAMRHALEVANRAHGPHPTFLHATESGRPVYERMGYEPVAFHTIFMEKRFLGDH